MSLSSPCPPSPRPGSVGGPPPAEVTSCVEQLGHLLLASTPHSFHPSIARSTLTALSTLLCPRPHPFHSRDCPDVDTFVPLSQEQRRRRVLEEQAVLAFPPLLCRPSVTTIQLSGVALEPSLVSAILPST